jgi:hypothetical protein
MSLSCPYHHTQAHALTTGSTKPDQMHLWSDQFEPVSVLKGGPPLLAFEGA